MKRIINKFWPFIFLAGIFIFLFYNVFFLGQVFYDGDNFHLNIPEKYFFVQQLLNGHLPLWNPYLFLGIPYLADFNLGTLNPTNLIYFILPVPRALTVLTVFDFFGLSIGMYLLLQNFKLSKIASVMGAVIMSLSGMPFVLLGNMTFMQVIVYIPFIFLFARKFCQEKTFKWFLLLIILQFFQFIAGHPQETYYTMLFVSLYLLFFLPISFWKRIGVISFYIAFPLFLGAVQFLSFLEYVLHANRPVGNVDYAGWGGLTTSRLVTFIFPTFYGSHANGTWWGPQQILVGFIGVPTLFLLYIGVCLIKFKEKLFVLGGFVLSFILAFGKLTPFFYIFYYLVPGWKLFRAPAGILVFFTFFAAILASFGLEHFTTNPKKFYKIGKLLTIGGFIFTIISGALYIYANKSGFWRYVFKNIDQHMHKHFLDTILFYDSAKIQQMFQGIIWNIIYVALFIFMTGIIITFIKKKHQGKLLLILIVLGFFIVNPKVLLFAPISYYDPAIKISHVLKSSQEGKYRVLSIPVNLHQNRQHLPPANFFYAEGQVNLAINQYDNNIESGLYQAGGYASLVPGSFSEFIGNKDKAINVTNINFSTVNQKQLNLSSIKYIISHEPIQNYNNISLKLIYFDKEKDYIYENTDALPRAYIKENPKTQVMWNKNEPTEMAFSINSVNPAHLIITDWYYPGWKAYVNGKEMAIRSYLSTFQEIPIPKGKASVQIVYDPSSFKIGLVITIAAMLGWSAMFVFIGKKKI